MVLSPRGASSITRGHKGTMAGRTVASQRIKQWSDGLCTDCDQFWTHFCHIVLKVMILMVVSSTTTLFSFLLVDICFLSDLVMHPGSKIKSPNMSIKNSQIYSRVTLYTAGHLHTAVPHCSHSRAPIVHTAVPRENNEHGCVYLRCRAVCKLPGCVEGHPSYFKHIFFYN